MRQEACAAIPVPAGMADTVAGYAWSRDHVGESGGAVYRLYGKPNQPDLYLKTGKDRIAGDIADEMVRLCWLAEYLPVPRVEHFTSTPGEAWLLMTALPGETAYQVLQAEPQAGFAVVDALAAFLRDLHAIPVDQCPFMADHRHRLAQARARIDAGLVEEDDFADERQGWTAEQVWQAMNRLLPLSPDPVVTHGDFSLDNLLMLDGRVVGCIDVGRAGIADRYQDLAILWNCLGEFDASLRQRLFDQYGLTGFGPAGADQHRLHFHLLLDELF